MKYEAPKAELKELDVVNVLLASETLCRAEISACEAICFQVSEVT